MQNPWSFNWSDQVLDASFVLKVKCLSASYIKTIQTEVNLQM